MADEIKQMEREKQIDKIKKRYSEKRGKVYRNAPLAGALMSFSTLVAGGAAYFYIYNLTPREVVEVKTEFTQREGGINLFREYSGRIDYLLKENSSIVNNARTKESLLEVKTAIENELEKQQAEYEQFRGDKKYELELKEEFESLSEKAGLSAFASAMFFIATFGIKFWTKILERKIEKLDTREQEELAFAGFRI